MKQIYVHKASDVAALLCGEMETIAVIVGDISKLSESSKLIPLLSVFHFAVLRGGYNDATTVLLRDIGAVKDRKIEATIEHSDTITAITESLTGIGDLQFVEMNKDEVVGYIVGTYFEIIDRERGIDLSGGKKLSVRWLGSKGIAHLFVLNATPDEITERMRGYTLDEKGGFAIGLSAFTASSR